MSGANSREFVRKRARTVIEGRRMRERGKEIERGREGKKPEIACRLGNPTLTSEHCGKCVYGHMKLWSHEADSNQYFR